MRPVGVVSKKLIGDLNIAKAILSCILRDACHTISLLPSMEKWIGTNLNGTEDP